MPLDHLGAPAPHRLLGAVLAEGRNIAVWRRPLPDGLSPCLAPLMAHGAFVASAEAAPTAAVAALAARLPAPLPAALRADILALAAGFTALTGRRRFASGWRHCAAAAAIAGTPMQSGCGCSAPIAARARNGWI